MTYRYFAPCCDKGAASSSRVYNYLISRRYGVVYFEVAKVASRSLRGWLCSIDPDTELHMHEPLRRSDVDGLTGIVFVRDPYTRVASCWVDKVRDSNQYVGISAEFRGVSFETFVEMIGKWDLRTCDEHVRLQSRLIPSFVSCVGRFESLQRDLDMFREQLNLPSAPIEHRNRSALDAADPHNLLTLRRTRDLYAADLHRFSYPRRDS